MADPKRIEQILSHPVTQRILRAVTANKNGADCLLSEIFAKYGSRDISLIDRIRLWPFFAAADYACAKAGATREGMREKLFGHHARARALINTARAIGKYGLTRPQIFSAPLMVVWNFTQACNFRCVHCYQDAHTRMPDELSLDEQLAFVDELVTMDVPMLAFSGGEPMMGRTFWEVVKYAGSKGLYITLATNGSFITEESAARLVEAGVKYAEVSVDSVNPEKHDEFRGVKGAWDKAVTGLKHAIANPELRTGLATTVTRRNIGELRELIEFAIDLGAETFYAFNFIPTGRATDIESEDITPEQREEMLKILHYYLCEHRIAIVSSAPQLARACLSFPIPEGFDPLVNTGHYGAGEGERAKLLAQYIGGCGAGRCYLSVQPNGDVTPCVFMPVKVGSIRHTSLQEIWDNDKLFALLRDRDDRRDACRNCEYKYHCGGCRARPWGYFRDMRRGDPGCIKNLAVWKELQQANTAGP